MRRPTDSVNTNNTPNVGTAGIGGLDNLDMLFAAVKRSMSPTNEIKDEPLGMLQTFENIQIQKNMNA
jgi:hypothetical protein